MGELSSGGGASEPSGLTAAVACVLPLQGWLKNKVQLLSSFLIPCYASIRFLFCSLNYCSHSHVVTGYLRRQGQR